MPNFKLSYNYETAQTGFLFVSLNSEKSLMNHQHCVFEKQFVVLRRPVKLFTACIDFTKSTKHYRLCIDNDSLDRIQKRVFCCLIY